MTELTEEQSRVVSCAIDDLLNSEEKCTAIVGAAGTGKSFTASRLLNLLPQGYTAVFLAYTNKATYNLEKFLTHAGLSLQCECSTIHRYLKLSKQVIDEKTGKRRFKKSGASFHDETINPEQTLLIIDEMGTVPNNEESPIVYELMQLDNPILALGDKYQLPPPMEKEGALFSLLADHTYELDEVLRYKGGLLECATHIRRNIYERNALDVLYQSNHDGHEGVYCVQPLARRKYISDFVNASDYRENPDRFRVLTWRKKTMDYWNSYIKALIYGEESLKERFVVGERIIAMETCSTKDTVRTVHSTFNKTVKLLSASQEGTIQGLCLATGVVLDETFTYHLLDVKTDLGANVSLRVLVEGEEQKRNKLLKSLASRRLWGDYWELKDYFHDVKSAFSLNIDRCQGITLENTFIDLEDVMACRDVYHRNRIGYTMLTRCKYQAFV